MKATRLSYAILSLASATSAISLHKRHDGLEPRVLALDLQRSTIHDPVGNDRKRLARRSGSINVGIDNLQSLYFFNASLGTPAQDFRLHLDTGSSDLWVNANNSTLCSTPADVCSTSGLYNAAKSSTYKFVSSEFNITYADGSGAAGDYATETFRVGKTELKELQFGIGYETSSDQGVLGIGYSSNEAQVAEFGGKPYDNLPAKMAADGLIASNAYSLWLNDLDSASGTILFGGVDRKRFTGDLVTVPIQKFGGRFSQFYITLTGLSVGSDTVDDNLALGVILDSGSTLTYLPTSLAEAVFEIVGADYEQGASTAYVPCDLANASGNLTFSFSSPAEITVPLSELVLDFTDVTGRRLRFDDGEPACMFGIAPSPGGTNVLGDTFLRSAYVVFDLGNNEVSLAQSNFDADGSDVVEIGSGDGAVPAATGADEPVTAASGVPASSANGAGSLSPMGKDGGVSLFVGALTLGFVWSLV
ncbi:hypothetical protein LCI18_004885 [Fusarium solani-melongenae]|uniref:Uncharacterized protein n=1 Tax=Fusarium solani subsp. cucurbitae TaxID=2747967 RepID=A0ACD3YYE1_FUSSC|nr:hypothetical protein LCI18_004885 [Fusarium solani-melongenae]